MKNFDHHYTVPNNIYQMAKLPYVTAITTPTFMAYHHEFLKVVILFPGEFNGREDDDYLALWLKTRLDETYEDENLDV